MDVLLKVGSIVLLLGGLIFVHELGHFVVAKLLGVKVVRFSIGFGPRLFGVVRGETEYQLALLPLGGYVKMAGDDPTEEVKPEDRGRGFLEQKPWKRLVIALAGPAANLVFPFVIYVALGLAQNGEPTPGPTIGTVTPGSPAETAGLRPGDRIVTVTAPGAPARPVRYFTDLRELVSPHPSEPLVLEVEREGKRISPLTLVPAPEEESNPIETTRRGVIGVTPAHLAAVVAPALPGAAGPLEPFDLVVRAGPVPIAHFDHLRKALGAAACAPLDLEVLREAPIGLPGANVSSFQPVKLAAVPTCLADGSPALVAADPAVAAFVGGATPGSPAEKAGLRRGDRIVSLDGKPIRSFRELGMASRTFEIGKEVKVGLADGRTLGLVPAKESYVDELTRERQERMTVGLVADRRAEVDPAALLVEQVPLDRGVVEIAAVASRQLTEVVRVTVLGIVRIVTGDISFKTVGGPIMLVSIASEAVDEGLSSFLFKMALISVNLGLMNLLPIPVLDGGHIAQSIVESVTRRPLSLRAREIANAVGLILLFTLMIFVFKNDIVRLMG